MGGWEGEGLDSSYAFVHSVPGPEKLTIRLGGGGKRGEEETEDSGRGRGPHLVKEVFGETVHRASMKVTEPAAVLLAEELRERAGRVQDAICLERADCHGPVGLAARLDRLEVVLKFSR